MSSVWGFATLIVVGVIIANLVVNPGFATTFFSTVKKVYQWAVNSMMGGNG